MSSLQVDYQLYFRSSLDVIQVERKMEELRMPRYYFITADVSAYTASSDECGKGDGITASGMQATEGVTIAADDLPFGTKVEIQGHTYIVQDRFGGNYRNRVDVYMDGADALSRANEFGRREMLIKILEERN